MNDLLALAERCEREKPSVDLHYQIEWAISDYRNDGGGYRTHKVTGIRGRFDYGSSPKWLESIDAAVTLLPEGWLLRDMQTGDSSVKYCPPSVEAAPHMNNDDGWAAHGNRLIRAKAKTLPLAIVAASLRARAAISSRQAA